MSPVRVDRASFLETGVSEQNIDLVISLSKKPGFFMYFLNKIST
jgi:hypothetical protein